MRLRWTPAAANDLESIDDYLAGHLPSLRRETILEIYEAILALRTMPHRGRPGRENGTRELVLPRLPYIVVYRIKDSDIEILHIYHGAQHWP
ncbi:MAG: type II toxin-antitoxin system RelE/ParE family toxin [Terracidiphilus sp.]